MLLCCCYCFRLTTLMCILRLLQRVTCINMANILIQKHYISSLDGDISHRILSIYSNLLNNSSIDIITAGLPLIIICYLCSILF